MKYGKGNCLENMASVGSPVKTLRTAFCDGGDRGTVSTAQREATRECQYPSQSRPRTDEPFEPYGLN